MATYGLTGYLERYAQAKTGPRRARQVPATSKRLIWEWRVRKHACCGQKIAYVLEREYHVRLSVPKVYAILAEKYVIRSKGRKNQKRGAVPRAACTRAAIQMDTVAFGHLGAFTGVDIDTTEAEVVLWPTLTSDERAAFLRTVIARRFTGRAEGRQPDGGPACKGAVAQQARTYCDRHRSARPYKKNEQAYSERFNRTLRKECLSWGTYRADDLARVIPEVEPFLARYPDHRPHLGFSPLRPPRQPSPTQEGRLSDFYGE